MDPFSLVALIGFQVVGYLATKYLTAGQLSSLQNYISDAPTVTEGDPIPIVFGRMRIRKPAFMWYGPIHFKQPIDSNITAPDGSPLQGSSYGTNMLFNVGVPMGPPQPSASMSTKLVGMYVGDKKINLNLGDGQSIRTTPYLPAVSPNLYARNRWGDVEGLITFFAGGNDQRISNNVNNGSATARSIWDTSNPTTSLTYLVDNTQVASFMRGTSLTSTLPGFGATDVDGTLIPGFRNQMLVALTGDLTWLTNAPNGSPYYDAFYMGPDPHILPFSFEVQTYRNSQFNSGWVGQVDADPATVLYDILTSSWSKIGVPTSRIDISTFVAASATLLAEGNGYSRVIDTLTDAKAVLQEIVSQIGGALYMDPVDGMVRLKLLRADYTIGALPSFSASDVITVDEYTTPGWRDVVNQVRVSYTQRAAEYASGDGFASNMASAVMQDTLFGDVSAAGGAIRSVTVQYPGCTTLTLATQLAARDLNLLSQPLAQIKLTMTRSGRSLRPGDCFVLSFPDYYIAGTVFRVVNVDLGAPGAGVVQVTATQDAYANGAAAGWTPIPFPLPIRQPPPCPVTIRKIQEAPRWLMQQAIYNGLLGGSADTQRMLVLGVPDDAASSFQAKSLDALQILFGGGQYAIDVKQTNTVTLTAKVHTAYPQELGPYDTTTGLVIDTLPVGLGSAQLTGKTWTHTNIAVFGSSLILVDDEIMAYESATDLSGTGVGPWRLNNVWRALLDTSARDHAVGARMFWIGYAFHGLPFLGVLGKADGGGSVYVQLNARLGFHNTGSGEDIVDVLPIVGRHRLPAPVANLRLCGEVMSGTQPTPTVSNGVTPPTGMQGFFAKVSNLEEGFGVAYQARNRTAGLISRGDEVSVNVSDTVTAELWAQKTATVPGQAAGAEVAIDTAGVVNGANECALLGGAGYGDIDVILHNRLTVSGSAPTGDLVTVTEWQAPKVHVYAPRWRNLLANPRFLTNVGGGSPYPGWTLSGTATIVSAAAGAAITRVTGAPYAATTGLALGTFVQTVDVTGYRAKGMDAYLAFYAKDTSGLGTLTAKIEALSAAGAVLGTSSTGASMTTAWSLQQAVLNPLPALTTQLRITISITISGAGGGGVCQWCEPRLRLGQVPTGFLANTSFETGPGTSSWTNVTNSFVANTGAIPGPSANYVGGGAFATSAIRQDYTVPTGYEVGTDAVLTFWRATHFTGDLGTVTLSCRDGGSSVLASTTTGATTNATLDVWALTRLSLQVPEGTVTIRVDVTATRTAGSGNSGALFDDFEFALWKDLSDARSYTAFDFSVPTVQPIAATWQEWHAEHGDLYRAGVPHPIVIGGNNAPSRDGQNPASLNMVWADGLTHTAGVGVGQWGGTSTTDMVSLNAALPTFVFARGGIDYHSVDEDPTSRLCCPDGSTGFTAIVLFKVDEDTWGGVATGLFGRRDTVGWQLEIDATGHVYAGLTGAGGSVAAVRTGSTVHDGAWHLAALVYDPTAHTLTAYDERGGTTTTGVSVGSLATTSVAALLRLGRSRATIDTLPGMIRAAYWFDAALTGAQVAAHWNYAKDPTGLISTYSCPAAGWIPGPPDLSGGETIVCVAADQVGLGYAPACNVGNTGAAKLALVTSAATTNRIPSWDFTSGSWVAGASSTLTQGIVDATGQARGVTVADVAGNGIAVAPVTVGTGATSSLVFWAAGGIALDVVLKNSSGVVKQTVALSLASGWKRYVVQFTAWDNSTATAIVQFTVAAGGAFSLSHVMHLEQGAQCAALIPRVAGGTTASDTFATQTITGTRQWNAEGEVEVLGAGTTTAPVGGTLVAIDSGALKNYRELAADTSQHPVLYHYDSASANVLSTGTVIDWSQPFDLRGRWSYAGLLDTAAPGSTKAGLVVTASVNSATYGRTTTWTYDATLATRVRLGAGLAQAFDGFLQRVIIRAREEKLV